MTFLMRALLRIDAIDEPLLERYNFSRNKDGYYRAHVRRTKNSNMTTKCLHQLILGDAPDGMVVDHINRDRGDNRRANLRFVTVVENAQNRTLQKNSLSGFRGVSYHIRDRKWKAHCHGKYLGYYATKEEAAAVAKAARCVSMPYSEG